MKLRIFLTFVFFSILIHVSGFYDYNSNCQEAFQAILNLKTNTAREILNRENTENPGNSYVLYLEHYADAVELIVTGDPERFDRLYHDYYTRRKILDQGDPASPYHKLIQAEMMFHLGLAQLKFGNKLNGASKIYNSYYLIKDNIQEFPEFWMNIKLAGSFNVIFANIPGSVRWIARIIGLKGDMETGLKQLMTYFDSAQNLQGYSEEGVLFINFAYKYVWDEEEGLKFYAGLDPGILSCTLVRYFYANLSSFAGKNEMAIELLGTMLKDHYEVPFYGVEYQLGRCKLNRLDEDAEISLQKYLNEAPGLEYKKDICKRLSYYYLINGDTNRYLQYKSMVSIVGSDFRDRDREAILESNRDYIPLVGLLKARMLFDGGYYERAEAVINEIPTSDLGFRAYELEYYYRIGRIFQKEGRIAEALDNLTHALDEGEDEPFTFATLAAYQLGMIYEKQGDYQESLACFEKCIDLYDPGHTVESIENQAESGIKRVKSRL